MRHRWIAPLVLATLLVQVLGVSDAAAGSHVAGSGTGFSFSGTLVQPNGPYDFQYQAFDALTNGNSVAGPVIVGNVRVIGSRYSTSIDFGSNPFTGAGVFLQISWRKPGTPSFTQINPRVELIAVPYALGVKLPLSESTSTSGSAFAIANNGSGAAVSGTSVSGYGVTGSSASGFAGVYGNSGQNGVYGESSSATNAGMYGHNSSSGWGVAGLSAGGYGVYGESAGSSAGVAGISDNGGYGVTGAGSSSSFAGVYGTSGRNGLYGESASAADSGIYGHNSSSGYGVAGFSDGGIGGYFKGGGGANAAIKLENGGIQVSGAGYDTPTPVFTHLLATSNICGGSGSSTVLDNPFLNGNPNAFVFLSSWPPMSAFYNPSGWCGAGHWLVNNMSGVWHSGDTFQVLVIVP